MPPKEICFGTILSNIFRISFLRCIEIILSGLIETVPVQGEMFMFIK